MKPIRMVSLSRRSFIGGMAAAALPRMGLAKERTIEVWKTPTCGCCAAWVEHLQDAGFNVAATDVDQGALDQVKDSLCVPTMLRSCHTARVGGYVVEGHVPAEDIELLLSFTPEIAGIAVPGMPVGSPGMEMGGDVEPYATYAFDKTGPTAIFARHDGA